jgi:uncharacterized protein YggU (UPF0235/DUF167 family)
VGADRGAGSGRVAELRFAVRVTPRASRDQVDGVVEGVLLCRVAAAPADGAANASLLRLLGRELGIGPSRLRLVAGAASRRKLVAVDAGERARLVARWPGLVD